MTLKLNYTAASDRGLVRDNNEDSGYASPSVLVIADGMGGHAAGEIASQIMVDHLAKLNRPVEEIAQTDKLALLTAYSDDANREIAERIKAEPETDGMGSTLTALLFDGSEFGLIHAGDSRGYRLRDGELEQITVDDTFVQSLVEEGKLDPGEVSSHPHKSLILKAYTGQQVEPTLSIIDARPGDRLLLCSDGLSDPVQASTIAEALGQGTPDVAAQRLIELALRSGGPDNVTIIVADVIDDSELDDTARAALPVSPIVAGAPIADGSENTHPDSAASRAAALLRNPQVIPPSQGEAAVEGPADHDEAGPRTGRWLTLSIILVLILALVGGAWFFLHRSQQNYYLTTNDNDQFVIHQGVDFSVFGRELNTPLQKACIDNDGALRFVDTNTEGTTNVDCSVFSLQDLPASARASIDSLEGGSYDEVTVQLRRLADEALPVCITTQEHTETPRSEDEEAPESTSGDLAQPGVNCREVR